MQIQVSCNCKYSVSDLLSLATREGTMISALATQIRAQEPDVSLVISTDTREHYIYLDWIRVTFHLT
jgi:hypothetical protein